MSFLDLTGGNPAHVCSERTSSGWPPLALRSFWHLGRSLPVGMYNTCVKQKFNRPSKSSRPSIFKLRHYRVIAEDDQQLSRGVGTHPEALAEGR